MERLLNAAGLFTATLGVVHFFMPRLLDFDSAIPKEGPGLRPIRLPFFSYDTLRTDVRGIALVMNSAVSVTLVTIGVVDLLARDWLTHPWGPWIAGWIAGWWLLRAVGQFHLGRRRGDWLAAGWFAALAGLHGWVSLDLWS